MKSSNRASNLLGGLSNVKIDGSSLSTLVNGRAGASTITVPSIKTPRAVPMNELKSLSLGGDRSVSSIRFGSPSSSSTGTSKSSSEWPNLLKQSVSGGVASLLGGGSLSAMGGLGGLVSGIVSLFGGGTKTLPPLVRFALPTSQSETIYAGARGSETYQGSATESAVTQFRSQSGQYQAMPTSSAGNQSQQVVNVVKQALLNSSSLNDIISEI